MKTKTDSETLNVCPHVEDVNPRTVYHVYIQVFTKREAQNSGKTVVDGFAVFQIQKKLSHRIHTRSIRISIQHIYV